MNPRVITPAVAASLLAMFVIPGSAAEPERFRCQVFAFSPNVARDRMGLCATLDYDQGTFTPNGNASVYRTTDLGRTWKRTKGTGLSPVASHSLKQIIFSPAYATDSTVYLHAVGRGLLRSTDAGDTWLPVAPLADSPTVHRNFTPLGVPGPGLPASTMVFADSVPALVSPPVHVPVAGTPGHEMQFLVDPPSGTSFAASLDAETASPLASARTRFYACDAAFACTTRLFEFPSGLDWQDGWLAPDFASTGRIFAILADYTRHRIGAWISTDRGRTFQKWAGLDAFLTPLTNNFLPIATIATRPGTRTMFARITARPFPHTGPVLASPPAPPGEQILRSDDAGKTWRRVAYGLALGQQGRRGTLPWNNAGNGADAARGSLELLPDGRLVTLATTFSSYFGVFVSADGGRTWIRPSFG